jgi:hypothetical protein
MTIGLTLLSLTLAGPPPELPPLPEFRRPLAQQVPDLVPTLVRTLSDPDAQVRQNAALSLAEVGAAAVPDLTEALTHQDAARRAGAAYALGQMGGPARPALDRLLKALNDPSPAVRRQAARAVGRVAAALEEQPATAPAGPMPPPPVFPDVPPRPAGPPGGTP